MKGDLSRKWKEMSETRERRPMMTILGSRSDPTRERERERTNHHGHILSTCTLCRSMSALTSRVLSGEDDGGGDGGGGGERQQRHDCIRQRPTPSLSAYKQPMSCLVLSLSFLLAWPNKQNNISSFEFSILFLNRIISSEGKP